MKKIVVLLMIVTLCVSLCACGSDDTKTDATEASTQFSTQAKAETKAPTESPTEKPTEEPVQEETQEPKVIETQAPTEKPITSEDLVLADVTGLWEHAEYGSHYTIEIKEQNKNDLYMVIWAVRGNAAQIASSEVNVKISIDAAGGVGFDDKNLGGRGTFRYIDSFNNEGQGEILIDPNSITLSINQTYNSGSGWGIMAASGNYVRT